MSTEETRANAVYYTVINGKFHTKVEENHPEAVKREYETKDGAKAYKFERIVDALTGYIEDLGVFESDFGKRVVIKLDPNHEGRNPVIQLGVETNYGEDFLKRAPSIDFTREIRFAPYSFTDENGRDMRGISLTQQEEGGEPVKLGNFFFNPETKETLHGFPVPEGNTEEYSKEDWKIHFLKVRKFLLAYTAEHVLPKLANRPARIKGTLSQTPSVPDYPEEEITPEDIPF